jgi:hypothetical protein
MQFHGELISDSRRQRYGWVSYRIMADGTREESIIEPFYGKAEAYAMGERELIRLAEIMKDVK